MGHFHKAGRAADIALGKLHCVEIEGRRIALFSLGEEIYALGDLCTQECPIIEARTDREAIVCPLHEARFTARTNASVDTIERYNVRVQDGDIEIEIS
jgi:nitrite reductase/ring-hydroxylating ferredoxin subunit